MADVLRSLGLKHSGEAYVVLRKVAKENNIDLPKHGKGKASGKSPANKISLEMVLVENSGYPTNHLKKRLIEEGILEEKCSECGIGPEWNEKKLVLQLDHQNGKAVDHRLENLRILCPNCHSQTANFAGKNKKAIPR